MTNEEVPHPDDFMWPTLKALENIGGSASIKELLEAIIEFMKLSEIVLDIPHSNGSISVVEYRCGWARTYLKRTGAINNSEKGVWAITDLGRKQRSEEEVRKLVKKTQKSINEAQKNARERKAQDGEPKNNEKPEDDKEFGDDAGKGFTWEELLLDRLKLLEPDAFERLCQRLLRESGFTKVEVTGKSGDKGIDGIGILRINLLSFRVCFQSKRYSDSVSSAAIREFRGSTEGRADKRLFITTGRFTREAKVEAMRDGGTVIDLIDGIELCRLMKDLNLGVESEAIEHVSIKSEFFENL